MKLINNYMSTLQSYLPSDLKVEVREELEASIHSQLEDKAEALGREPNEQEQADLLTKLGHPMRVASSYLPNQQLIGPDYFPAYKQFLKMAVIVVFMLHAILSFGQVLLNDSFIQGIAQVSWGIVDSLILVFGIVTLVFHLMQKFNADLDKIYAWSPQNLKTKNAKLSVSRAESLFDIFVAIAFLAWWNGLYNLPVTDLQQGLSIYGPLQAQWDTVLSLVNAIVTLSIINSFYKYVLAGWNKFSLMFNIALSIAAIGAIYYILGFDNYVMLNEAGDTINNGKRLVGVINSTIGWSLAIVAAINVWEIISCIRKLR